MANKAIWIIIVLPLSLVASCVAAAVAISGELKIFGTNSLFIGWLWSGEQLARLIAHSLPHEMLYGSPNSRFYWPEATYVGLRFWLSVVFWWAITFAVVFWRTATGFKNKGFCSAGRH